MKLVYTFALFAILAITSWAKPDAMEDMKALSKICNEEVHSTHEEMEKFFKNGMNPADATDTVKCHMKCMMEKQGHLKNGVFDEQSFVESMLKFPRMKDHKDDITKFAVECKDEKGDNDCDTAFKIGACIKNNLKTLGLGHP